MNDKPGPWLLVVVDGPSEVKKDSDDAIQGGAITKIVEPYWGDECAAGMTLLYWRHVRASPRREGRRIPRGFAATARHLATLGNATAYGTVLLVDNDNDTRQDRLAALQSGAKESGFRERTAIGVARQMLESWLLADDTFVGVALPDRKRCEKLWGDKHDSTSNWPKHVLRRCVLEPKGWAYRQAIEAWNPQRARQNAPSLDAFLQEVERLAKQYEP